MDIPRQIIKVNESMFEGYGENTVESELIIPDYYPDVLKIIRTEAVPRIKARQIIGDKLEVMGMVEFRVIYVSEDNRVIRCVIHSCDFSHYFDLKNTKNICNVRTRVKVEYVGCKLVNSKKANLKAIIGIAAKVFTLKEIDAVRFEENEQIQMLEKSITHYDVVASVEKNFKIVEELELGQGKPSAEYILKNDVDLVFKELKIISNKIITKGEAVIKTMYSPEGSDDIEISQQNLPFSQIIDLDNVDEDCECDVKFEVSDFKASLKENMDGQNRVIQVEIGCVGIARAIKNVETSIVVDAFNTEYQMDLDTNQIDYEKFLEKIDGDIPCKGTLRIDEGITSVIDVSAAPIINSVNIEGNSLVIDGNLETSVLAISAQDEVISVEKAVPFNSTIELKEFEDHMRCEPDITLNSINYSILGENDIDIKVSLNISAQIYGSEKENYISDMTINEESKKSKSDLPVLTLFFAQKGENFWNIAKRYDTSPAAIKKINNIEGDTLSENKMLIIQRKTINSKLII